MDTHSQSQVSTSNLLRILLINSLSTLKSYLWTHHLKRLDCMTTRKSQTLKTKPLKCWSQFCQSSPKPDLLQENLVNKSLRKLPALFNQKLQRFSPSGKCRKSIQQATKNRWTLSWFRKLSGTTGCLKWWKKIWLMLKKRSKVKSSWARNCNWLPTLCLIIRFQRFGMKKVSFRWSPWLLGQKIWTTG